MSPALMPMFVRSGSGGGKVLLVLAGALVLFAGGVSAGYQYRGAEVADLAAQRNATFAHAQRQAETLSSIKATLRDERERRNRLEQAAQQELAARAERIATLEAGAVQRRANLNTETAKHEDCTALRRLPVCAALADGLYGQPPAAGTH